MLIPKSDQCIGNCADNLLYEHKQINQKEANWTVKRPNLIGMDTKL